jgi:plasmid stability protein
MRMLTIRNLESEVDDALRAKARREKKSINTVVLETLRAGLLSGRARSCHDLDTLAGSWSPDEAARFDAAVSDFSLVDTGLWK